MADAVGLLFFQPRPRSDASYRPAGVKLAWHAPSVMQEDSQQQLQELAFLRSEEANGQLMLLQLPAALPIPVGAAGPGGAVLDGRPAQLSQLPPCRVGKLLVFESGAVKLQVRRGWRAWVVRVGRAGRCLHGCSLVAAAAAARGAARG